jgi:6-methylsalicylate decarboxylase
MDEAGIAKSILSITSPGTHLETGNDTLARQLTQATNNEIAGICKRYPDRFEFFAVLPLPDVEGSIAEIDRALDELGAVGFVVMTNGHGYYLGDQHLDKVFAKLNERNAILFMHPTSCSAHQTPDATRPLSQYPAPMMEFFFDTTRAVVNLLLSKTVSRYQNITFLVSHCGATLPALIERVTSFSAHVLGQGATLTSDEVKRLFRTRFYFDLAGFPFPDQIHGLLRLTDSSRLLYGSDFPYTPAAAISQMAKGMDASLGEIFTNDVIKKIYHDNAAHLLGMSK